MPHKSCEKSTHSRFQIRVAAPNSRVDLLEYLALSAWRERQDGATSSCASCKTPLPEAVNGPVLLLEDRVGIVPHGLCRRCARFTVQRLRAVMRKAVRS